MTPMSLPGAGQIVLTGILATVTLDLWALTANRVAGLPITNWGHVGRWMTGMLSGTLYHPDIATAPHARGERFAGWLTHYVVGIVYAATYLTLVAALGSAPAIYSAGFFGLVTVLAPWLILQPCLGSGFFAANAPNPGFTRRINLSSHLVFGTGLYIGFVISTFVF